MNKKIGICLLNITIVFLSVLIYFNSNFVYAIEDYDNFNTENYDIIFVCATSDNQVIMTNESFKIYKIADEYENITEDFTSVKKIDNTLEYAESLKKYVEENGSIKEYESFITDENGKANIIVPNGTYLVIGENIAKDNVIYTPEPLLLNIDRKMYHELTSYVKYESEEIKQDEDPTSTGDDITRAMKYLIISLVGIMIVTIKSRKGNEYEL